MSDYLTPELPEEFYLAHDGFVLGRFRAEDFVPYEPEPGAMVCQYVGERPIILRVFQQRGDRIWTRDGIGATFVYSITPVPPPP